MKSKSLVLGLVIGASASAIATLFLAPKAGKELRNDIAERSVSMGGVLKEIAYNANTLTEQLKTFSTEGIEVVKDVVEEIEEVVGNWNKTIEPDKQRLKDELKDLQKTVSALEKTVKG
ncbi:YtxH domain-containing protein [Brochothrix campestris]|uniref:General stress protein n=1 Tax=Brochothrix campestris FSL F6-1037 TaxID=1265861 RepID=W7CRL3_9LIST|nr:YtxH domain-containing protein [Brochothrix campestris]EUJ35618.1 hypothetical protein BCAMP_11595 [Brochothrix campestris FSL F6-1037]